MHYHYVQASAISSGDSKSVAMATASAFGGGSKADAYSSAISQGIQQYGCGFYQQAIAQVICITLSNLSEIWGCFALL